MDDGAGPVVRRVTGGTELSGEEISGSVGNHDNTVAAVLDGWRLRARLGRVRIEFASIVAEIDGEEAASSLEFPRGTPCIPIFTASVAAPAPPPAEPVSETMGECHVNPEANQEQAAQGGDDEPVGVGSGPGASAAQTGVDRRGEAESDIDVGPVDTNRSSGVEMDGSIGPASPVQGHADNRASPSAEVGCAEPDDGGANEEASEDGAGYGFDASDPDDAEAEAEALTVAGTDGGRGRPLCTLGDRPTASPPGPSGPPIGVGGNSLSARARLEALRNELMLELTWARQAAASRRQYLQIKKSLLV